jgi:hypothetical protein
MKIEVLKTTKGASCPLGIAVKEYEAGKTYEIFDKLAKVFISNNWGKLASEKKAIKESPENKALSIKIEDKSFDKPKEVKQAKVATTKKKKKK